MNQRDTGLRIFVVMAMAMVVRGDTLVGDDGSNDGDGSDWWGLASGVMAVGCMYSGVD